MKRALVPLFFLALWLPTANRASAADIFTGQTVYKANCANCHGIDGRPVLPGTPDLTRGAGLMAPDSALVPIMKTGKGLMPGFEYILSEKDILNVLAYTRTLQR
ncbi:MAG: c-type cytochrome [Rhodospirillales bacterium]